MSVINRGDGTTQEDTGGQDVCEAAQYTVITTAGTTTVKATAGLYFGAYDPVLGTGTASTAFSVFDGTVPIQGSSTLTAVNQLSSPLPAGIGIRVKTALVVVTAGTGVNLNVLWD